MKDEIQAFLDLLGGDRNPWTAQDNHKDAIHRIKDDLRKNDIPAEIIEFDHYGFKGYNLWIPPPKSENDFILLLAHHDTVPECPGVDDNGSGMVLVYLLAKWYYSLQDKRELNLAFVMPDFEEGDPRIFRELENFNKEHGTSYSYKDNYFDVAFWGKFRKHLEENLEKITGFSGTRNLIDYLKEKDLFTKLKFVIDYETVGYTSDSQEQIPDIPLQLDRGDFLAGAVNAEAQKYILAMNSVSHPLKRLILPLPNKGLGAPDTRRSDHSVFWDEGIDAVLFTDTANFRNPHYHKPTDTTIDFDFIVSIFEYSTLLLQSLQ